MAQHPGQDGQSKKLTRIHGDVESWKKKEIGRRYKIIMHNSPLGIAV